jgi:hypothetical protein
MGIIGDFVLCIPQFDRIDNRVMETMLIKPRPSAPPAAGLFGRAEEKALNAHDSEQFAHRSFRPSAVVPDRARDGEEVGPGVNQ